MIRILFLRKSLSSTITSCWKMFQDIFLILFLLVKSIRSLTWFSIGTLGIIFIITIQDRDWFGEIIGCSCVLLIYLAFRSNHFFILLFNSVYFVLIDLHIIILILRRVAGNVVEMGKGFASQWKLTFLRFVLGIRGVGSLVQVRHLPRNLFNSKIYYNR